MKKITISKYPTINQALKSELIAQENAKPKSAYQTDMYYGYNYEYSDDYDYSDFYNSWCQNDDDEDEYFDDYGIYPNNKDTAKKRIYFYDDLGEDKENLSEIECTHIFNNIAELKDFCLENGIYISNHELSSLRYRYESHCTLDPIDKYYDSLAILSDSTIEELWWSCCEVK